ncbi:MAG: thymidine phosphorylase, partial [Pirellulaceae bacterium]
RSSDLVPLITASIMSKKLAEGLTALVLDVKWGSGAFMKSRPRAEELARSLVDTGERMGVATTALITDMNQPLGRMAGNAVEVDEALLTLAGKGPPDLVEVTIALGAELLVATGRATSTVEASRMLDGHLQSGAALTRFDAMVRAQGGDLDRPRPTAPAHEIVAPQAGFVRTMDVERLGQAVIALGGGRRILADRIDHAVGFEMLVRLGDRVDRGQPLVRVLAQRGTASHVDAEICSAIELGEQPLEPPPLIMPFTKDPAC